MLCYVMKFNFQVFSRLKKSNPESFKKVVPVTGDITLPNLGLTPKDEQTLIDKVICMFSCCQQLRSLTTNFTPPSRKKCIVLPSLRFYFLSTKFIKIGSVI